MDDLSMIIYLLLFVLLLPVAVIILGLIMLFSGQETTRRKGKRILMISLIVLGSELVIGFALCSSMIFG